MLTGWTGFMEHPVVDKLHFHLCHKLTIDRRSSAGQVPRDGNSGML